MKFVLTGLALFFGLSAICQTSELMKADADLRKADTDSARVKALLKLSVATKNFDSAFMFADRALEISKAEKLPKSEAASYKRRGDVFFDLSNYPGALKNFLYAFRIYDSLRDHQSIAPLLNSIANVYARQDDYATALEYYRRSSWTRKLVGEDERIAFFGIGKAHEFLHNHDSALTYYQRAYEYLQTTPTNPRTPFVLIHLGNIHRKKKNDLLALSYARMAASYVKYAQDSVGIASIYTHIAEIFQHTGERDSAIYYAQKAFEICERIQNDDPKVEAALLLADLYASEPAKAYKYYRIGKTIEDSIFGRAKQLEIQSISYEEKMRETELIEAKQKEEVSRRNNIQYAGIGVGLALVCLLFLLLSRSFIVNERAVKFLGILILLMVFEFLNLILHPYIGNITHHSPILMLLALVAIAALLIPTHHHLEHWITKKMVQKNKKVRLQTARKIVERLEKEETETP